MPLFGNLFGKKQNNPVYDHREAKSNLVSGPPTHPKDWLAKREAHYERYLGPISEQIRHETTGMQPHIDIYTFPPDKQKERSFTTLVTSGMSNLVQKLPKGVDKKTAGRVELIWYIREPEIWMYNFLFILAKTPFVYDTYLFHFHTLENGFPNPEQQSAFQHLILLPGFFEEDGFQNDLVLDGCNVNFLWPIPITQAEMDFKRENGAETLIDRMEEKDLSRVYIPEREPLV